MLGFLYKDIRTNRKWILIMILVLTFLNLFAPFALIFGDSKGGVKSSEITMLLTGFFAAMSLSSFLCVGGFAMNFVQTDERKKWGYYVVSLPGGIIKQVVSKYIFTAGILMLTLGLCSGVNAIFRLIWDETPSAYGITLTLFAIELIMRAVEMPCIIAFGSKIGTQVKGGLIAVIVFAIVIYLLFGDLSWIGSEESFWESFFKLVSDFKFSTFGAVLLLAAVPVYIVSCMISTKLYLKGIERMVK